MILYTACLNLYHHYKNLLHARAHVDSAVVNTGAKYHTIEELIKQTGISDAQLDTEIPERDLHILAGCFDNFDDYMDKLELIPPERTDVRRIESKQNSCQSAIREMLRFWRTSNPDAATFRSLLHVVISLRKHKVAEDICKFIVTH